MIFCNFHTCRKVIQWAGLDPLAGRFWPAGRTFDTPDLESSHLIPHIFDKYDIT